MCFRALTFIILNPLKIKICYLYLPTFDKKSVTVDPPLKNGRPGNPRLWQSTTETGRTFRSGWFFLGYGTRPRFLETSKQKNLQ